MPLGSHMVSLFSRGYRAAIERACSDIRAELDDHLETINASVRDTADIREILDGFEEKFEKLNSRIDELYLFLGAETHLTEGEQGLVQFLQGARSLADVAAFLKASVPAAERALRLLGMKGVTVHQFAQNGSVLVTANPVVRDTVSLHSYL